MGSTVTPLMDMQRRAVDAGRLRYGVKTDKAMKAIECWRITSRDKEQIERLAELYGGTARPWNPGRGRSEWEVITTSKTLNVVVPPPHVALGGTPIYEAWTAAGLQRRCDGEIVEVPSQTPHGTVHVEQPCICEARGKMLCKPITRLNVMLPEIPFSGLWMMESKGWNAAKELPGMVDLVFSIQDQGYARAWLTLEKRTTTKDGKTSHFVVPVLTTPATLNQLAEGGARLVSIAANGEQKALAPASPTTTPTPDDDVAEAEVVDEEPTEPLVRTIQHRTTSLGLDADQAFGLVLAVTNGEGESLRDLTVEELERIVSALDKVSAGTHTIRMHGTVAKLVRTQAPTE